MKEAILRHNLGKDNLTMGDYVPREGLREVKDAVSSSLVKVIMGPRMGYFNGIITIHACYLIP
jgi:hypothetical protein